MYGKEWKLIFQRLDTCQISSVTVWLTTTFDLKYLVIPYYLRLKTLSLN